MFIIIMTSICKHAKGTITNTTDSASKLEATKKHFTIAMALAVMFGLGWAFGLAATSLPVKELTITFQVLFSLFVGLQGFLIFLLHGLRNMEAQNVWRKWLGMAANAGSHFIQLPHHQQKFYQIMLHKISVAKLLQV